ncbi:MBG domain-containing protein, partial [Variovorax sp. Varisp62]|uniref:MBG domain-containing protein n=1 Tax=Variovorax sp. Varisp62 TaxID=3243049 RepID=UPI0039B42462
ADTVSGARWRVWADTWVGETRGGLAGSAPLPNFYHCAYLGLCTVTVPATGNHFIYAQQPLATVTIGNAQRAGGLPNPPFVYSISGLILGDTGAGIFGVPGSPATRSSPPGFYPIDGSFTSAEGYAVRVVPGQLQVSGFVSLPSVDVVRDQPTTWLYDRNIGQAPICLATGPLDGDRAQQGADVLAREWSRVRSRPNLLNCVDTEKRNGCADF